jgi:hypothetical protein
MMQVGFWCRIHDVKLSKELGRGKQFLQQLERFPFYENFFILSTNGLGLSNSTLCDNPSEICQDIHLI